MPENFRDVFLKKYYTERPEMRILEKVALIELFLLDLFSDKPAVPGTGEIILSSYIMGDGIGDYIHIGHFARALREKFPDRKISTILLSDLAHQGKLSPIDGIETVIEYVGANTLTGPYFSPTPLFSSVVVDRLNAADLLISGPAHIREPFFDAFRQENRRKTIAVTEYDYEVMGALVPFIFKLKAGLGPDRAGIFIPAFRGDSKESYYFSYMRNQESFEGFIHEIERINPHSTIKYILRNRGQIDLKGLVELIELKPLTESEFNQMVQHALNPVGCTGDHALAAVICLAKIPFYEVIGHKAEFLRNYIEIVKESIGQGSDLYKCLAFGKFPDQLSLMELEVKKVSALLAQEFNLSRRLQGAVNWVLYKNRHPNYADKEQLWVDQVLEDQITLGQFKNFITNELLNNPV